MQYKDKFQDFLLRYEAPKFEFLARPNQNLLTHISNILKQGTSYLINELSLSEEYKKLIHLSFLITSLLHDFGKLNPYFQYRIYSLIDKDLPPLKENKKYLSFHTLISACFCDIFIKIFYNFLPISEQELNILKLTCILTILCHHSPTPSLFFNDFCLEYPKIDDKIKLFKFFEEKAKFKAIYEDLALIFHKFLKKLDLFEKCSTEEDIIPLFQKTFEIFVKKYTINDSNDEYDLIANFDEIEEFFERSINSFKDIDEKFDVFCIILFNQSLMCDLDIWDARFFLKENNSHSLSFTDSLPLIDNRLIENYVSKPFGEITFPFEKFISSNLNNPINHLRSKLFEELNSTELLPYNIYTLNSPTGAGKTLNLLNIAHKIANLIYKTKGVKSKIIYALPFISIGDQVAEQILKIFSLKNDSLFNNTLLTVDNYLTENKWSYRYHDQEDFKLIGRDAKWLISSWRSQYIITTFVKFYNSILKPKKQNYLKFHRFVNSIILLDEIQCLPVKYWEIIRGIHKSLCKIFRCTIILSTATQPAIMGLNESILLAKKHLNFKISLNNKSGTISKFINRYNLRFYEDWVGFSKFKNSVLDYCLNYPSDDIMIVLNTRRSVSELYNFLKNFLSDQMNTKIYLLSTLILTDDRLHLISKIKKFLEQKIKNQRTEERIILITTQLIEAGVDISFKTVFRDIAPLDSIIQVAGRCNRGFDYNKGDIFVFKLFDDSKKNKPRFYHQVYESGAIILGVTEKILKSTECMREDENFGKYFMIDEYKLRKLFNNYFTEIKKKRITNDGLKKIESLNFIGLSNEFTLIQDYEGQVPIFIERNENATKILQKIIANEYLNSNFYRYTIIVNQKDAESLKKRGAIKEIKFNQELSFYLLPRNKCEDFYHPKLGLIIS